MRIRNYEGEGRQPYNNAVRTIEDVARELGLSRQRVQQLEASALRKLRRVKILRELAK
jgi:DNA-directed RNA polymerase sigma subunit (sigma70/sigma32)